MSCCKHLAASLFYIKNNEIEECILYDENKKECDFDVYIRMVKYELDHLLYQNGGYFDWKNGDEFVHFIYDKSRDIIENLDDNDLDKKIIFLYKLVDEADYVDGSNGEHYSAVGYITDILNKLLETNIKKFCDIMEKINAINLSYGLIDKSNIMSYIGEDYAKDDKDNDKIPSGIDIYNYIDILIDLGKRYNISTFYLKNARLIEKYCNLDKSLDYCYHTLLEKYNRSYHFQKFIDYYLDKLEKNKLDDKLLEVLDFLISNFNSHRYNSNKEYYELCLKILKRNNNIQEYNDKYLEFYKKYPSIEKFNELKNIFNLERDSSLYKILLLEARRGSNDLYVNICVNENLFDDAFGAAKNDIDILTRYGESLEDKYREEMIDIYIKHYKSKAGKASCRKDYQNVISGLLSIKNLKLKDDVYNVMIDYIETNFRNRPAFQDELEYFKIII